MSASRDSNWKLSYRTRRYIYGVAFLCIIAVSAWSYSSTPEGGGASQGDGRLIWTYVTAGILAFMIVVGAVFGAYYGIWMVTERGRTRMKLVLVFIIATSALVHTIVQGADGRWPEEFETAWQPIIAVTLTCMVAVGAVLGAHFEAPNMSRKRRVGTEVALMAIVIVGACVIALDASGGLFDVGDAQPLILAGASSVMSAGGAGLGAHYAMLAKKMFWIPVVLAALTFVVILVHIWTKSLDVTGWDECGRLIWMVAIIATLAIPVVAGAMLAGYYSARMQEDLQG